jgi:hypothetical protein
MLVMDRELRLDVEAVSKIAVAEASEAEELGHVTAVTTTCSGLCF